MSQRKDAKAPRISFKEVFASSRLCVETPNPTAGICPSAVSRSSCARRTACSAMTAAESASRACRCASITSRFVVAPASNANVVILSTSAACSAAERRLASARSLLRTRFLRDAHLRSRLNLQARAAPAATREVGLADALQATPLARHRRPAVRNSPTNRQLRGEVKMLAGTSACGIERSDARAGTSPWSCRAIRDRPRAQSAVNSRTSGRRRHPRRLRRSTAGMSKAGICAAASAGPFEAISTPSASCARLTPNCAVSSARFDRRTTSCAARSSLSRVPAPPRRPPLRVVEVRERRLERALCHFDLAASAR